LESRAFISFASSIFVSAGSVQPVSIVFQQSMNFKKKLKDKDDFYFTKCMIVYNKIFKLRNLNKTNIL